MKLSVKESKIMAVQFLQTSASLLEVYGFLVSIRELVMCYIGGSPYRFNTCIDVIHDEPETISYLSMKINEVEKKVFPGDWVFVSAAGEFDCVPGAIFNKSYSRLMEVYPYTPPKEPVSDSYTVSELDSMFSYHNPTTAMVRSMERIRKAMKAVSLLINDECPSSTETELAIQTLVESKMRANQAISINSEEYKEKLTLKRKRDGIVKHLLGLCANIKNLNGWEVAHINNQWDEGGAFVTVDHDDASVKFRLQYDTVKKVGKVGVQIDDMLIFCYLLLKQLNEEFPCEENELALSSLGLTIDRLELRTKRRTAAGIEGKQDYW